MSLIGPKRLNPHVRQMSAPWGESGLDMLNLSSSACDPKQVGYAALTIAAESISAHYACRYDAHLRNWLPRWGERRCGTGVWA